MTVTVDSPQEATAAGQAGFNGHKSQTAVRPPGTHRRSIWKRVASEGGTVFALCFGLYIAVGVLLDFHYLTFNGDATSRMANGFYVLYSRDPHLAAIGFVWNPGTSIVDLIPLLFYPFWHPLASHAFAASIASAGCMAGAVYQVRCTLAEWGVARAVRLLLVTILALNGMILYYGGSGMSEGLYLFTLLATCRYLLRWLRQDDLASLVYAAVALGLCYLARNEAVGPAFAAGVVVLAVGFVRRSRAGDHAARRSRIWGALTDAVIFEIPFVFAFAGWAVVSYVITGQAFGQFSSVYGTASQLKVEGQQGGGPPPLLHARILHDIHDLFYLAPTIPLVIVLAIWMSIRRRDVGVMAPLAVVGAAFGFDALAYLSNSIAQWFRYFITAVPLEVLLVGCIVATNPAVIGPVRHAWVEGSSTARRRSRSVLSVALVLLLLLPSGLTTLLGMKNPTVGFEENQNLGFIFVKHISAFDRNVPRTWPDMVSIAGYFSHGRFTSGQVVVDNFSGCVPQIITIASSPKVFVIPNDRDFQRILADPIAFHTHYILDVEPKGNGTLTALNTLYPALWKTGAGFAKQVHAWPAAGECPAFRLFKVMGHPNQGH
jgi:hypothetical protein